MIASEEQGLTTLPKQFYESIEGDTYLKQILNMGDGILKDCFSYFTTENNDNRKPRSTGAHIRARITVTHKGQKMQIDIFDASTIGPSLVSKRHVFGTKAFVIEATDRVTTQKARPIRKQELPAAFGFERNLVTWLLGEETKWPKTFNRLQEIAPV